MHSELVSLLRGEWIGKEVEISSKNATFSIKAKIIDETKNTFSFLFDGKKKVLLKSGLTIKAQGKNNIHLIDGVLLKHSPENRIKVKYKGVNKCQN